MEGSAGPMRSTGTMRVFLLPWSRGAQSVLQGKMVSGVRLGQGVQLLYGSRILGSGMFYEYTYA